jgi:ABC-type phosphate transport system substrate-binding protein
MSEPKGMIKELTAVLGLALAGCGASADADAIVTYGRDANSGTYAYLQEHVLGNEDFAADVHSLPDTAGVVHAVSINKASIGYGGIGYVKGVRALRIKKDAASPGIDPTLENVQNGSYPISRTLYFYTVGEPGLAAKNFITWVRSQQGQKICGEAGFYPLAVKQWAGEADTPLQGKATIAVKGSDTMLLLSHQWADQYMKSNPEVSIQITGGGSGTGIAGLLSGDTSICQSSRPMKAKERIQFKSKLGKEVVEFAVAMDGLAVFVHDSNTLHELSLPQLKSIFTGKVKTWAALSGP